MNKKRITITALACFALMVLAMGCEVEEGNSSDTRSSTSPSSNGNSSASSGWTKAGNMEIRVIGLETYDSSQHNSFNSPNARAELRVRKVGGDEYDFALATVTLIDTSGVGYDADIFCVDCPEMIDETVLYDSTAVTRYAYFEVPSLTSINRLRFEPFSFTTDPVVLPVP